MKPYLSFVVPTKNEEDSVIELHKQISAICKKIRKSFEIVFVDDGSTDKTFDKLCALNRKDKRVRIVKLRGWWGKSMALQAGFNYAEADIIFTMDADLQDDPLEIPNFLKKLDEGYDMVSGWKKKRYDPISKTLPSKIGNFATRLLTGIKIHDLNCGFKVYRRQVIETLNLYGELYKYIPVLVEKQNFKVGEIIVKHKARKFGKSKFGWTRNIKGFVDMLTVVFITGFSRRPAHFFGISGFASFAFGFLIGMYISYLRFTTGSIQYRYPLLFLGILLMVIGIQLVTTGLIAELIINRKPEKKDLSNIEKVIG